MKCLVRGNVKKETEGMIVQDQAFRTISKALPHFAGRVGRLRKPLPV